MIGLPKTLVFGYLPRDEQIYVPVADAFSACSGAK